MTWTRGRRELCLQRAPAARAGHSVRAGHLEHRQAPARARQAGRHHSRMAAVHRRCTRHPRHAVRQRQQRRKAQPHHPDRAPQRRRAAATRRRRPDQPRDSRATHLRRTPPHHQAQRPRPRALARRTLRLLRPATRTAQTLRALPVPRLHRQRASSKHTTSSRSSAAAKQRSTTSSCSAPATTNSSTTTTSTPAAPATTPPSPTQTGRAITTNQPHAPPR